MQKGFACSVQACRGMRMIYSQKVTLVPIKEMTDVLSVEKKSVEIDQNTWIRVKTGIYKGDLAKVVDVDHVRQRAQIKLIPRIDLQALAAKLEGRDDMKKRPKPAPRFISIQEVKDLRIPVDRKRDGATGEFFDYFGGLMFKDGYFYKNVSLKTIDAKGIEPSLDELQKFQKPGEDGLEAMGLPPAAAKTRGQFMKGDTVVVVEGDLRNLMGIVEKVDDDSVFIRPKNKDLKGTLTFKDRQLRKFFKTGDHVKVIAGKHEGATGMIVKIQNNVITLLSDTTREDIDVFSSNIVESSEITSGITKLGDYELHDLVALDQSTVGVIVRVEKDGFQILKGTPERAEVVPVKPRDIRRKVFDKNLRSQDRDMNVVSSKDIVRVSEGLYKVGLDLINQLAYYDLSFQASVAVLRTLTQN
jgi:transcription elongation factor SPT5